MRASKWFRGWREARSLFVRTREYENNIVVNSAKDYRLRWVVRYHVLVHEGDYSWMDKFSHPASRRGLLRLCGEALREMEYVWGVLCMFDSNEQYFAVRGYLQRLRWSLRKYPILFWVVFRPWLGRLRGRVEVRMLLF